MSMLPLPTTLPDCTDKAWLKTTSEAPKIVKLPPVMLTSPSNTTRPEALMDKSPCKAMSPSKVTSSGKLMMPALTCTPSTVKLESGSSTLPTSEE